MTKLGDLKIKLMKNPKFKREYENSKAEFAILEAIVQARRIARLTQKDLAELVGTSQAAIARIETGKQSPTANTLLKLAEATGTTLEINFKRHSAA